LSREVTPEELSAVAVFRLVFDTAAGCVAFDDIDTGGRVLPLWPDDIDVVADQLVDGERSVRGINGGLVLVTGGFTEAPFEGPNCGASEVWAVAQSSLCSTDGRSDLDAARFCLSHPAGG
jgi:hypothetical protein